MKNKEIAEIFSNIAIFLELKDENIFKINAYRKAAVNIECLVEDIIHLKREGRLSQIPGVGKTLVEKINEYLDTGIMTAYEKLKKEIPLGLLNIVNIPSVGPRRARLFYDKLKIKDVDGLFQAAETGRLLSLPGIKKKTVENILRGIKLLREGQERMNLAVATSIANSFTEALCRLPQVKKLSVAGSLRRCKETVRDIDILVVSRKPREVMEHFVHLSQVGAINVQGDTKSSILTRDNIQVDLRVVDEKCFGAALLYFTGSKSFNIKLRQIGIKKEMKVSEYGVFSIHGKKERFLAGRSEKECFRILGLDMIPPELREDIGEKRLFSQKEIPRLIEEEDIQGDLHVHSTWSDGRNTIEQMAKAAQQRGYSYIGISDHSKRLRVARGLSVRDLVKKKREIDRLNKRFSGFRILYGTEVEIDANGELDYNNKILREFDIVIAAIHNGFEQSRSQLTKRLLQAIKNKYVHVIAHPTGNHIGKRKPYDVDFKEVCQAAVDTNTFLEINAFPVRLDLNSVNTYYAKQMGVRFAINTDAHAEGQLSFIKFGVAIARRGWLEPEDVVNTFAVEDFLKALKKM